MNNFLILHLDFHCLVLARLVSTDHGNLKRNYNYSSLKLRLAGTLLLVPPNSFATNPDKLPSALMAPKSAPLSLFLLSELPPQSSFGLDTKQWTVANFSASHNSLSHATSSSFARTNILSSITVGSQIHSCRTSSLHFLSGTRFQIC